MSPDVFLSTGGSPYEGAVSITTAGTITDLGRFPSGYNVASFLVAASNGRAYASAAYSVDPATLFSVTPTVGSKKVYSPQVYTPSLTYSMPDGGLLGVALGSNSTPYLVKANTNGVVTPIHPFPAATHLPHTAIYAADGNIYGVSYLPDGSGSVYRVAPDGGGFTKVVTFPANAFSFPISNYSPLLQSQDGNLYGVTATGGANGTGTIFKLTLSGQLTAIYQFPAGLVANPTALIEGSDGNLYGTTMGTYSALFRVTKTGQYSLVHAMNGYTDGQCQCQLTQGIDGVIYGTAALGGPPGLGDVFALDASLPKPTPWARSFEPYFGSVGTRVRIWGANLLSATVQFNGTPAAIVSNSGSSYVWATVPSGATTGPITVTTPGGTYTTQGDFTVQ